MVVEHVAPGSQPEIYRTVRGQGRLLPDGLTYVDSWISASFDTCFQLMECDDPLRFQAWVVGWGDRVDIEVIPVTHSSDTSAMMARLDEASRR